MTREELVEMITQELADHGMDDMDAEEAADSIVEKMLDLGVFVNETESA